MGYSDKYGYVATTRHGRTGPIAEDEPVAVFRAQDEMSVEVLIAYLEACEREDCAEDHVASVRRQIDNFALWQRSHSTRRPGDQP